MSKEPEQLALDFGDKYIDQLLKEADLVRNLIRDSLLDTKAEPTEAYRRQVLSLELGEIPASSLAGLATVYPIQWARRQFEDALREYARPGSNMSKAGNFDVMVKAFVSNIGGPFSKAEIETLCKGEKIDAEAARLLEQSLETAYELGKSTLLLERINNAVRAGTRYEDFIADMPVPD
jgi:hypothetical protein